MSKYSVSVTFDFDTEDSYVANLYGFGTSELPKEFMKLLIEDYAINNVEDYLKGACISINIKETDN